VAALAVFLQNGFDILVKGNRGGDCDASHREQKRELLFHILSLILQRESSGTNANKTFPGMPPKRE